MIMSTSTWPVAWIQANRGRLWIISISFQTIRSRHFRRRYDNICCEQVGVQSSTDVGHSMHILQLAVWTSAVQRTIQLRTSSWSKQSASTLPLELVDQPTIDYVCVYVCVYAHVRVCCLCLCVFVCVCICACMCCVYIGRRSAGVSVEFAVDECGG